LLFAENDNDLFQINCTHSTRPLELSQESSLLQFFTPGIALFIGNY